MPAERDCNEHWQAMKGMTASWLSGMPHTGCGRTRLRPSRPKTTSALAGLYSSNSPLSSSLVYAHGSPWTTICRMRNEHVLACYDKFAHTHATVCLLLLRQRRCICQCSSSSRRRWRSLTRMAGITTAGEHLQPAALVRGLLARRPRGALSALARRPGRPGLPVGGACACTGARTGTARSLLGWRLVAGRPLAPLPRRAHWLLDPVLPVAHAYTE